MTEPLRDPSPSLVTLTHVTYALHALGLALGAFGAATVVGSFIFGWPSIAAVIMNYVNRSKADGTWLASHFTWQIRTFWWACLGAAIVGVTGLPFTLVLIGFAMWAVGFFCLGVWAIYRVANGWMRLQARETVG